MCTLRPAILLFVLLVSLFTGFGGQAAAQVSQDISPLEQLLNTEVTTVTGASKYQQELSSSPASVSIISADDIRKGGFRTLADALNSVRGFFITYHRSYHYVGVRGFSPLGDYNTRILLLVDGHRLNDAVYEQAPLGSDFPVDLDLVDRIEVIRGPGSSLYGSNAFMAVINVITRTGSTLKGGEFAGSGGSFDSWTGRFTGGGKSDYGLDLLFSGAYRDSEGKQRLYFPEYVATNNGIAQGLDGETSRDLLAKVSWKDITLLAIHQSRDKSIPAASFYTIFNDPNENNRDIHTLVGLSYNHSSGFSDLSARLTYNRYDFAGGYPLDNGGVYTLNRDETVAEWIGSDLYASKNFGLHLLTIGMEHRWQFSERQQNFNVLPAYNLILDDNHRDFVQGYYLQDEYHLLKDLILNAGLRYDRYSTFGGTLNPRVAAIWRPVESSILRFSYGRAFRAPNAFEQYYSDTTSSKGNTGLKPEVIHTMELSYDQYFGNYLRTNITGFYSHISDLLMQHTDPADGLLVFDNQSSVTSSGVELQGEGKWENGFSGRISCVYQETRISWDGSLNNSPRTLAKGELTAPVPAGKSFVTLEAIHTGPRRNASKEKIAGNMVVNLTLLNRDLFKGLELSASIYNLFNTRYGHPASAEMVNSRSETLRSIEQDGITFRVKANLRF